MRLRIPFNSKFSLLIGIELEKRELVSMSGISDKILAIQKANELYNQLFDEGSAILLDEYATNLDKVLSYLKLEAYEVDIEKVFENQPELIRGREISGFLLRDSSENTIFVEKNQSVYRKRFTIAHEIGHYVLEHLQSDTLNIAFRDDLSATGIDFEERAANAFAAELLMPSALVEYVYEQTRSTVRTAAAFAVSESAIKYRLKNLGVI